MCESDEKYVPLNDGYNWKGDPNATLSGQPIPQCPRTSAATPPPPGTPPPPVAIAEYDPATGTYVGPDGKIYAQSDLANGDASRRGSRCWCRRGTERHRASKRTTTMPCVIATMTPRTTMKATLPPTSIAVSGHSPALVSGGRKNSAGRSFMLTRRFGCEFIGTRPVGSRNVRTVGAGHRTHYHERQHQQKEEAHLETDEPGTG